MTQTPAYEVVVVGGGPAGLTTALYATRLGHRTALVNREGGRYERVTSVHNLLGVSEDASGGAVTELGIEQLEEYGADYYRDAVREVTNVEPGQRGDAEASDTADVDAPDAADADAATDFENESGDVQFRVTGERVTLRADRVVFATGFTDTPPDVRNLRQFVGRGLHYCLHCDAYALGDRPVFVLGHDDHAAEMAMMLLNFTDDVDLLLNDEEPTWGDDVAAQVEAHPVEVLPDRVDHAFADEESDRGSERGDADPWLGGLAFADGRTREYGGGFAVYGKEYNDELAAELGCDLREDGAIAVDDDRETSVSGAYAVGDVTHGQNQTPIALGDGAYAGIALHKDLRQFPVPADDLDRVADLDAPAMADDLDRVADLDAPAMADDLRARMWRVREADDHAGMTPDE
ncbi:NAD(P)/FAD-dependent oxidoreductase [Halorussus gelatinilyticus]|uniref:NAD(P)/FAD-dependent oxidoreductase n=1 Tax=Halorussus gelatinilyticus TaxID=2937524 RepID=A0A8U0IM31_9EURY|nr:NAD(P)/FAD-dependent oxidoreductase [Halorussus gelatinilyticus]UPW02187.1 NAD(P)/FAD-dependent oxidoreductase [Halorussus gelatinilyticus]